MIDATEFEVVDHVGRETGELLADTEATTAWDPEYETVLVLERRDAE